MAVGQVVGVVLLTGFPSGPGGPRSQNLLESPKHTNVRDSRA